LFRREQKTDVIACSDRKPADYQRKTGFVKIIILINKKEQFKIKQEGLF